MNKTIGNVAGGIGLLLALTSVVTLFVTVGSLTLFFVKLGLGLFGIALWAVTNSDRLTTWARSAFFYSSSVGVGLAFIGVLAAANFIAAKRSPTWDLTAKKIFSLSPQTETTLKELKSPVKALAFVEGPIPEGVEELFKRYAALSDKFTFEFKDPRRTPDLTLKYQIRQGQPAAVLVSAGPPENHAVLNLQRLANPQIAEQELTNGLIKLNTVGTQKLYFVVGHGELPLEPVGQGDEAIMASLAVVRRILQDEGYSPEPLNLIEKAEVPRDASALVIAGARSRFTEPEKKLLAQYLEQGGRLLYFAEAQAEAGLDDLLAKYGVQIEPGIVADAKVSPDQPYVVISPFFGDHELTRLLKRAQANVVFATTRALTMLREGTLPDVTATPIVLTTPYAWIETNLSGEPTLDSNERAGQLPLAAAVTRPTGGNPEKRADEARLLVFGDSDVLTGTFGYEPNRNLVLNGFAWATQQTQKITIRPPDRDISTIDLTDEKLGTVRLLAMDVFPTLLMAIGLTIWRTRRAR
jgi:ABC-type uncharacterized transport system involved in gliding motility auxiliary subunit